MKTKEIEQSKLDKILANYKGQEGALISVLAEVQVESGWIPPQTMETVADTMKIFPSQVFSIATFCPFLSTKPSGSRPVRRL